MASQSSSDVPFLARLTAIADQNGGDTALVFKYRGAWRTLTWRATLDEIDAIAAGLAKLGVTRGGTVAFDGEITTTLLLAAAATRALGASIRSIPLSATAEELDRVVLDPSIQLTVGQGREAVAEWSAASAGKREIAIVLDHAVPDSRAPDGNIVTIQQLRSLSEKSGWASGTVGSSGRKASDIVWFEESTDWDLGLETILDHWTSSRSPLALPETLIAATRDRAEISPTLWISSTERLEATRLHAADRLPALVTLAGRLTRAALQGAAAPWHSLLRARLRRALGFRRLNRIEVRDPASGELSQDTRAFFTRLSLRVVGSEHHDNYRPAPKPPRGDEVQFRELALASAASR